MPFSTLFFDLDDTLYPADSGVWAEIRDRIGRYMVERLGLPAKEVPAMRDHLFKTYGTTLRGLEVTMHVDPHDYLAFVHDVPVDRYIQPNPQLRELLQRLPQHKVIFTNADAAHARRVLRVLQLEDCFERIIDILDIQPYCKPMPQAFEIALRLAGASQPQQCVLLDDGPRNLSAARQLGFYTVQVGDLQADSPGHASIARINDLAGLRSVVED